MSSSISQTIIVVTGIVSVTILIVTALLNGVNGTIFTSGVGVIGLLAGAKLPDPFKWFGKGK